MLQIWTVTFPFFALVLCGYVAAWRGLLPLAAIPGVNGFVLFFALPCMLFRFGASTPIAQLLAPGVLFTYLLSALLVVGLVLAITLRGPSHARLGWNDAAFGALVGAFPNTGFMGVPLLVALMGSAAAGPAIVTIVVDMVVTSSLCIALSRLDLHDGASMRQALRTTAHGVATNPMPWAIGLGALVSALQVTLPVPLSRTVDLMADAASPVALFTIGAVLARAQMLTMAGHSHATHWGDVLPVVGVKLLVHPLLVWLVGQCAMRYGLPLDSFALTVLVLLAALPSASNVSLLAERYGADNGRIARIILVSTALAFFTFAAVVAVINFEPFV